MSLLLVRSPSGSPQGTCSLREPTLLVSVVLRYEVELTQVAVVDILRSLEDDEGRSKIFAYFRQLYKMIYHLHNGSSLLCPFVDGLASKKELLRFTRH